MPTNEERREVAARLRDIGVKTWHTSWHELYAIKNACGCYIGQDQQDVELKDKLADLIEPEERTCRNVADNYYGMGFVCSECTRAVPEDEYDHEVDKYCSGCGAKVVE